MKCVGEEMKPKWDDAPEWAKWLAQDEIGAWYWYSKKPRFDGHVWKDGGRFMRASIDVTAEETLEKRP
jgi:hypothetical protein